MSPAGVYPHAVKDHSPELVERIRALYIGDGLTQRQIGAEVGVSQDTVHRIMQRYGIPTHRKIRPAAKGSNHGNWRGDSASYSTFHKRVRKARGTPSECSVCGTTDPSLDYDWASLSGHFEDLDDYARMCRPCHRRFDDAHLNFHTHKGA
jgi:transcriptional regulator with XRE-family HTH domain